MKKALITLAILYLSLCNTYPQDREPSRMLFDYTFNGTSYFQQVYSDSLMTQRDFIITNQWGDNPYMMQALRFNCGEGTDPNDKDTNKIPGYTIRSIYDCRYDGSGRGFIFEPTLFIDPNHRGEFITRPHDTTNAIWGFSYIKGEIPSSTLDPNFDDAQVF